MDKTNETTPRIVEKEMGEYPPIETGAGVRKGDGGAGIKVMNMINKTFARHIGTIFNLAPSLQCLDLGTSEQRIAIDKLNARIRADQKLSRFA